MTAYIVRRLFATLPVMAVVALFVFFLLRLAPGDPAAIIAGEDATSEAIAAVRAKLGLDRPLVEQFVVWLWALLQGDMGVSIFSNLPVTRLMAQRVEPTVALTLSTLFVAVSLAVPIGVVAAWKARKLVDRLVMGFAVLGFAMPVFVLAYVLIYFFAVQWQLLPVQGYQPLSAGLWPFAESLILPSVALGITYMALDRPHHARLDARGAAAGLYPYRQRQGPGDRPRAAAARAEERLGAHRHRDRHRHCAPDLGRRHHRDRVQHPGPRPAHRRCRAEARLSRSCRA